MTPQELSEHIHDCGWHMECSYASFQAHGNRAVAGAFPVSRVAGGAFSISF